MKSRQSREIQFAFRESANFNAYLKLVSFSQILESIVPVLYREERIVFNNQDQNGKDFEQHSSLSEKVIALYETRLREKDELIAFLRKKR